jgi:hypothetical protein
MEANRHANSRLASRYTYDWTSSCKIYSPGDKLLSANSTKWESVNIDGIGYVRIVEENGKPFTGKRQLAEQKRSDTLGQLGKDYDFVFQVVRQNPRNYIYSDLPISYLDTLFDNRVLGHQSINGRDNLVVESIPKFDAKPLSDRAKTALDWRQTIWIDVEDEMPTRYDVELLNRKNFLLAGTITSIEFTRLPVAPSGDVKLPPNVWLLHNNSGHFLFWPTNSEVLKSDYYNYKRFQADARVLQDSVQEIPQ